MSSSESESFQSADESSECFPKSQLGKKNASATGGTNKLAEFNSASGIANKSEHVRKIRNFNDDIRTSTNNFNKSRKKALNSPGKNINRQGKVVGHIKSSCSHGYKLDDSIKNVDNGEEKIDAGTISVDGWGDFDDWGEANESNIADKMIDQPLDGTDVIKQIDKGNDDIIGNISSYDRFPVLSDLSSHKIGAVSYEKTILDASPRQGTIIKSEASGWNWKPWGGVVSFLSTASEGVSCLTSQVSQGLSNVIESGMGVPDPEEMARLQLEMERKEKEVQKEYTADIYTTIESKDDSIRNSLGHIVSGVTQIGNKVITGGLDTLEGIGKRTMIMLQDNDAFLINKRKFLGLDGDKAVLSQMLREAKEKSEETEKNLKQMQKHMYRKQLHFETLFDHYHGLVHLEALEMLSKQSSIKLQSLLEPLTGKALLELQETLNEVNELCDLGEMENDETDGLYDIEELQQKINVAKEDLAIDVNFSDLIRCWKENIYWLSDIKKAEAQEVYDKALNCLAETTALTIHKMHKIAELLLIKDHHSTANEADSLVQLTIILCWHLSGISNRYCSKLNTFDSSEDINSQITSIFLEESNSTSYVRIAFKLFIPILQIGAV